MTDRYAVIGNPVEHSRSPEIHAAFARQTDQDITYEKLFAERDAFGETAARFLSQGGRGMNVTLPFKGDAYRFVDELSTEARRAEAVNTVSLLPDGRRTGDNTDGPGLVRDLKVNHGLPLGELRILLIGAGGAVQGVLGPILAESPPRVCLANRTAEKAALLAHRFADLAGVRGIGFDEVVDFVPFDLVINGTSAGLSGETPPLPDDTLAPAGIAYDMLYADEPTPFLRWAAERNAERTIDGLGMLVEQAAESFRIWRGVRPDTAPVMTALRPGGT